ncbi:MAG TPA: IclR family transcriptional regulator C-terminal domain-containing protein [Burkholderiales bacterium]|nr:IclR family transcriptional regulator C-terminal domain-containing protein [Burkholderiales bacterium]
MANTSAANPTTTAEDQRPFVRALARGLDVIVALGNVNEGMTLSEVAAAVALDRATARRLLFTLCELRYVRVRDKRFSLSPRVLRLGYGYLSSQPAYELAQPLLQDLADRTGESCSIGVLDEDEVVYVARAQSPQRVFTIHVNVGSRFPAYCTSMGRVLLAGLEISAVDQYLAHAELRKRTRTTVTDPRKLRRIIEDVRTQKYSVSDQEMEEGIRSVAVPLVDRNNATIAAMNVSVQAGRFEISEITKRLLPLLRAAATDIQTALRSR